MSDGEHTQLHHAGDGWSQRDVRMTATLVAVLLGIGVCFRLMHLSSIPGISGDEGWWGVQAIKWLAHEPYAERTVSGNPIDMLFLVPVGLLHTLAPPSFLLLRTWPAASNLIALAIGFWLAHRLYGKTTAWIQTVTVAIAPTAIAHSRFCQDPSQSILWTSLVCYLCLLGLAEERRYWIYFGAALVAFSLAVWTHPTNIFTAPFLLLPLVPQVQRSLPASRRGRVYFVAAVSVVAIGIALLFLLVPWSALTESRAFLDRPLLADARDRLVQRDQWIEFVLNYGRLFSGWTIYRYFADERTVAIAFDAGFWIVAIAAIGGMRVALRRWRSSLDLGLLFGWGTMVLLFFAFAGPEAIRPHVERWGLCLIMPATLILARALTAWIESEPSRRWLTIGSAALVATCLAASFYVQYFRGFETSGGHAHQSFVTAEIEPKQQALERILARRSGDEPVIIVAQQWWHFWPIAYLARGHAHVTTSMTLPADDDSNVRDALAHGRLFFVEFVGSVEKTMAVDWIRKRHLRFTSTAVRNAGGSDLLTVLQVSSGAGR